MNDKNPLAYLESRMLGSIEFVMDYYQLRFNGPVLTVYIRPFVIADGTKYTFDSLEFCNLLVSCIGQAVKKAEIIEGDSLTILFENGILFQVLLSKEDYIEPEAAMFVITPDNWWVW